MKPQTQTLLAVIAISSFSLLACDPGRSELSKITDQYENAIQNPTAKASAAVVPDLVLSLKAIADAHPNNRSGKKAKEQMDAIIEKVNTREQEVRQELINKVIADLNADTALAAKATEFAAMSEKSFATKQPLRSQTCVVTKSWNPKADQKFFSFRIEEIESVSKNIKTDGIQVHTVFRGDIKDTFRTAQETKATWTRISTGAFEFGSVVECNKAKNFADDYLATIAKTYQPFVANYKEEIQAIFRMRSIIQ